MPACFSTGVVMAAGTLPRALALVVAISAAPTLADERDGLYVGVTASAAFYDVDYRKGVDNRHAGNMSANAGRILFSSDSADQTTWDAGVLVGYRLGRSPFLDIEADLVTHRGTASGRLPGEGPSAGNNQLGEVWPEDWSQAKDQSYGLTLRVGTEAAGLGADLYVLGGLRRLNADFRTGYTGCLLADGCGPGELTTGREQHDEDYDAWVVGAGFEKMLGSIAIRGEIRYADHGNSERIVPFDEVAITVPVELAAGEVGFGLGLIWRP